MLGVHKAMPYCENLTVGVLTLLTGMLALYADLSVITLILCGTLLITQTAYKLLREKRGYEMLVVCGVLIATGISGALFGSALLLVVLLAASVYDCYCHRRLKLSSEGVCAYGAALEAEACRDIGKGGLVPSTRFMKTHMAVH